MEKNNYELNSIVTMKKGHPCGVNEWQIIRVGADIKLKCVGCGRTILMSRVDFNKRLKKVLTKEEV